MIYTTSRSIAILMITINTDVCVLTQLVGGCIVCRGNVNTFGIYYFIRLLGEFIMNNIKVTWKQKQHRYQVVMEGITGKYKAFEIFWDGGTNKEDKKKYKLVCMLHGIKSYLGHFKTEEEAKVYVETKVLPTWIRGLNDEQKVS